jgi:murein DD-endopeptidase MepM/ murein hydrolase activator NlpD
VLRPFVAARHRVRCWLASVGLADVWAWPLPTVLDGVFPLRASLMLGAWRDGATRKHAGVDLRPPSGSIAGAPVAAPFAGVVVEEQGWSGSQARALLIEGSNGEGVVLLGAIQPGSTPAIGTRVRRGEIVATLGRYPAGTSMLHFEWYNPGQRSNQRWFPATGRPPSLRDPTAKLEAAWRCAQS